ncbi:MAG: SGNH/GDSL hydrolase family protein [Deltaproteobacteria bacterium]|nr:SGNH/GDSL hydrolase family protein [Deltaproteobacteria bacterium]
MIKKAASAFALTILGLLFGLVIVEIFFRLFYSSSKPGSAWSDRPLFYYKAEAADSIQDYAYPRKKPENAFRIAVVGDSYSFAPYMQFTDTFPKRLEQILNLNTGSMRGEVINYGVPAFSTMHEVAAVDKAVRRDADLVMLQITLNDAELKPYRPKGINADMVDPFGSFKVAESSPAIYRYWKTLAFIAERLHNSRSHREYREYFPSLFNTDQNWREYTKSIKKIKRSCEGKSVPLVAVVFPLFGLPLDDTYPFHELHKKIEDHLAEEGIPFLDLFEIYRGIPLERLQVIPGADRHPNEIAHRMAAERIYLWLVERELIPTDLRARQLFNERLGITGRGAIGIGEIKTPR